MKKNIYKLLIILSLSILSCGYGYNGELPNLDEVPSSTLDTSKHNENIKQINQENITKPKIIEPLAPKNYPDIYSGTMIKQGKYSDYLKDVEDIVSLLEGIKQVIVENKDNISQIFCAKANILSLYVNSLNEKYANKPESHYESYKQIIAVNKALNELVIYWQTTEHFKKFIFSSQKDRIKQKNQAKQKINKALSSIELTLDILKNN